MNPARQIALKYLTAPADGLWRWAENGMVLTWHDGTTIAFQEEIKLILERLAPGGFPSFGSIVFLLAACRRKIPTVEQLMAETDALLPPAAGANVATVMTARLQRMAQLQAALLELRRLPVFPAELISGVKAKCLLAEAIFENSKAERHVPAREVLLGMQEPLSDAELIEREPTGVIANNIRQVHLVAEGLKHHTAEGLALRLRTGLESLPAEADLDLPPAERARRLIEELSQDPEHGAMARAASDLMAALRLPRRLVERDFVAVGCVADIANRGPLDRLLLSELAHDDLTLAVRVALNEALYLRREPPMREPPGTLALLLDSGVRMWGVPRVFATAVSLALVAKETRQAEILSLRSVNGKLAPVNLLSRAGLVEHLGTLEVEAHPGAALDAFGKALPVGERQSVLITHIDTLEDEDFRRALAATENPPGFIAAVDGAGRFELHELPLSRRPVCQAQLDVESLFKNPPRSAKVLKRPAPADLPAILGIHPFPFLLPIAGRIEYWKRDCDKFIHAMLHDRRLVRFRDSSKGARVLAWELPGGKTVWMDCVQGKVFTVKQGGNQRPARLLVVNTGGGPARVHDLGGGPEILAVYRYGEVILTIRSHDVRAFSLADGRLLDQARNPHRWLNGRFLRGQNRHYFASWDGESVRFQEVHFPQSDRGNVLRVFDRENYEGPWGLFANGSIASLASDAKINSPPLKSGLFQLHNADISRDGHRLMFHNIKTHGYSLIDLEREAEQMPRTIISMAPVLEPDPPRHACNIFRVIESVAVCGKTLLIEGRRGNWLEFILSPDIILRRRARAEGSGRLKVDFEVPAKRTEHGCSLQTARWASGSMAFLDSRGMLHLKSKDPGVPEISLVLAAQEVAGWTSDGHVCGPSYFFEDDFVSEPGEVMARVGQFILSL